MSNNKMIYLPDRDPTRVRLTKLAQAAGMSESAYIRMLIDDAWLCETATDAIECTEIGVCERPCNQA